MTDARLEIALTPINIFSLSTVGTKKTESSIQKPEGYSDWIKPVNQRIAKSREC